MEGIKKISENRFQLCGTQNCCPEVEIDHTGQKLSIIDDDQNKITLTFEQARLFKNLEIPG
jgi:hypothetical protein